MKNKILTYLMILGITGFLASCEKDGTKVVMVDSPVAPTITTMPDLSLTRANGAVVLKFIGTLLEPGFNASATYILEACDHGTNFANPLTVWTGVQDTAISIKTSDLNSTLLKKFAADQITSADFRIRATLTVDAGTGAPGTGENPFEYTSEVTTVNVKPYGFPRLDLIGSGITQKIESPLANSNYSGFVKLSTANPFTLKDPETNKVYGTSGAALAQDGADFTVSSNGWYKLVANTNDMTYTLESFAIGLVGSATPNGWGSPDQKMDYNAALGTWNITLDLVQGEFKFRLNDGWAWNLGGTTGNLTHNGSNCAVEAGNYTIQLTITVEGPVGSEAGTYSIIKN